MGSKPIHGGEEVETIAGDSLFVDFFCEENIVLCLRNLGIPSYVVIESG